MVDGHMEGRAPAGEDLECRLHAGRVVASYLTGCEDLELLLRGFLAQAWQNWTL